MFLESHPDLTDYDFTYEHLTEARAIYLDLFEKTNSRQWLVNPSGAFGQRWLVDTPDSTTYLIHMAYLFQQLHRQSTEKSGSILREKFRLLLTRPSESALAEDLAEFNFGAMLTTKFSPISLEPAVPEDADTSNKPKSPDYGLALPETFVGIDVTVWHWDAMTKWKNAVGNFKQILLTQIRKRKVNRSVHLKLPIPAPTLALNKLLKPDALSALESNESGNLTRLDKNGAAAQLRWSAIRHFASVEDMLEWDREHEGHPTVGPETDSFGGDPPEPGTASGFYSEIVIEDATSEIAVKSLRKALDRKRDQRMRGYPCIIAIQLGQASLSWEPFLDLIRARIWPNAQYSWVSAIMAFTPRTSWRTGESGPSIVLNANPHADYVIPPSIHLAATTEASFLHRP